MLPTASNKICQEAELPESEAPLEVLPERLSSSA